MQELILIRGLPGSGKSTLAEKICDVYNHVNDLRIDLPEYPKWTHIETDMFFMNGNEYKFDAKRLSEAHEWAQNWCLDELENDHSVVVSNTFSRIWEMQPYLDIAKEFNCKLTVLTCEGNHSEAGMSTKGANGNTHNVPEETIQKMRTRWEKYPS